MTTPFFDGNPKIEFLEDGRLVRVTEDFWFTCSKGLRWVAVAGLVCDGASIPRIAWPMVGGPFEGKHRDGAIIHDALYAASGLIKVGNVTRAYSRADADRVLNEAMTTRREDVVKRVIIYRAVRLFGWWPWQG